MLRKSQLARTHCRVEHYFYYHYCTKGCYSCTETSKLNGGGELCAEVNVGKKWLENDRAALIGRGWTYQIPACTAGQWAFTVAVSLRISSSKQWPGRRRKRPKRWFSTCAWKKGCFVVAMRAEMQVFFVARFLQSLATSRKSMLQKSWEKKRVGRIHNSNFTAGSILVDSYHLYRTGLRGRKRWIFFAVLATLFIVVAGNLAVSACEIQKIQRTVFVENNGMYHC